ncbi:MAG: DUF3500 domain-containing protein, partial [Pricia sp.]|nr:DUF3500 domain-containing protein [Pricia sp.]
MKLKQSLLFLVFFCLSNLAESQELHSLAKDFLNTLSPELREKTIFELTDEERYKFYYTPVYRKGSALKEFNEEQRKAALALLQASVSKEGYRKTQEIMALENILKVLENNPKMDDGTDRRDPLNYHFWI